MSRFLLPGAAVLCVLAGVGIVRCCTLAPSGRPRVLCGLLVVVAFVPLAAIRGDHLRAQLSEVEARAHVVDGLDDAIDAAGGADAVLSCGRVVVDDRGVPRLAAAWKLGVPLADVKVRLDGEPGVVFSATPPTAAERRRLEEGRRLIARTAAWDVYQVACPASGGGEVRSPR